MGCLKRGVVVYGKRYVFGGGIVVFVWIISVGIMGCLKRGFIISGYLWETICF